MNPAPAPPNHDLAAFLAGSVHDMKNSLGVMTRVLEDDLRGRHDAEGAARALYESWRLDDNLRQLLTLFQLREGAYPFDPREHALAPFAQDLLARLEDLARRRGVVLAVEAPADTFWWFDQELVGAALLQALRNALLYTRDRVTLTVAVGAEGLELAVVDNGPGFPPALLAAAPAIAAGDHPGDGHASLGLYFSGVVARLHRNRDRFGGVWLENLPGRGGPGGGRFVLRLP